MKSLSILLCTRSLCRSYQLFPSVIRCESECQTHFFTSETKKGIGISERRSRAININASCNLKAWRRGLESITHRDCIRLHLHVHRVCRAVNSFREIPRWTLERPGIVQLVALISMASNGMDGIHFPQGRGGSIAANRVGGHDIRLAPRWERFAVDGECNRQTSTLVFPHLLLRKQSQWLFVFF